MSSELENIIEELDASQRGTEDEAMLAVYTAITSHPKVVNVEIEHNPSRLVVTTVPIKLRNPSGTDELDLGRLKVFVDVSGSYGVIRDRDSPRASGLGSDNVHPHVSHSGICQGDATDMTRLASEKNLSMLIAFIIEFLQFYNPHSAYWSAFFKNPCTECGAGRGSSACKFCKCFACGDRRDSDQCIGCANWKQPSAGSARVWLKQYVDRKSGTMDEDDFIAAVEKTEKIFEGQL